MGFFFQDAMTTIKNYYDFEEVNDADTERNSEEEKLSWKNIMRQVLVSSTIWTTFFIYGLQIGTPTVIIPQLRKETNSSSLIDDGLSSWLTSMFPVGSIPWSILLPIIIHYVGRKKTYILICCIGFIGALIIYLSKTISHILVGEFVMGIILGSLITTSPFIVTEYTSPKYRGLFMTIKSASGFWGLWVANIIGTYSHWKNIYLLLFVCIGYAFLVTVVAWPESPYWLAHKKYFEDCEKTYRKLKGTSRNAEKDLDLIIKSNKLNEDKVEEHNTSSLKSFFSSYYKTLTCKAYYKPLLLVILLGVQYNLTGKLICSMYAIQILKKITQNEAMAYKGMLILDGVTVFGAYCGCVASRFCKRRKMLFTTSFITIIFLYIFAIYLFLIRMSVINENNIISIFLLAMYSVTVCSGPMILLTSIYGELISYKYQRSSSIIYGTIFSVVMATSLKISLFLFTVLTLPGAFLFFAIVSTAITTTIYSYLPETKNKSYYEIENYFKGIPETYTKARLIVQSDSPKL